MLCLLDGDASELQKLNARKAALSKSTAIPDKDKKKLKECLTADLMSSEESEEDGSFIVHPLPWRSEKATGIFHGLDKKHDRRKTKRSKVMTFARKRGQLSDRPKPPKGSVPDWTVVNP